MSDALHAQPWWQRAVVYEIFLRSFQDSNGDGIGDLRGVTQRLDYLRWLGVDCVWLTSFYESPLLDFGYDVSDHCKIHPDYGTLEDFDALVSRAHELGLKVLVDFVPCHTASAHPWFKSACESRESRHRSWYLWADPAVGGGPPNNWLNEYGKSAWTWHEPTGQYYFHYFLEEQPSLNWREPALQEAMRQVLRFWLDRGADGFRVDASHRMVQDKALRNNPPNPEFTPMNNPYDRVGRCFTEDQAENQTYVRLMREVVDEYEGRVIIGETHLPASRLVKYYQGGKGLHFPLNYRLVKVGWKAPELRIAIDELEGAIGEGDWPSWALGNHDQDRIAARVGEGVAAAMLFLLTLRGTPILYYGDEIALVHKGLSILDVKDPAGKTLRSYGLWRDPHRTPMQWDRTAHAGFSAEEPWLPISENAERQNVEVEKEKPQSVLNFVRRLLALRRGTPALLRGDYECIFSDLQVLVYLRRFEGEAFAVAINISHVAAEVDAPALRLRGELILATPGCQAPKRIEEKFGLRGQEGVLIRLESPEVRASCEP